MCCTAPCSSGAISMEPGSPHGQDSPRPEETVEGRGGEAATAAAEEEVEADPRGFHELAFLGKSNAAEAEPELEERDIGPEFDSYEDLAGDKLRLLDRCGLWVRGRNSARHEEGFRVSRCPLAHFFCSCCCVGVRLG